MKYWEILEKRVVICTNITTSHFMSQLYLRLLILIRAIRSALREDLTRNVVSKDKIFHINLEWKVQYKNALIILKSTQPSLCIKVNNISFSLL